MMQREGDIRPEEKNRFWNFIDTIEGDKVVWIIVFMLTMISALAIFSSTSQLTGAATDRVDLIKQHTLVILGGYVLIFLLYKVKKIGWFRVVSQLGFFLTFILLLILDTHANLGFIKAQYINHAWRTLSLLGFQLHVFEFAKIAMVMYLAWAASAYRQDQENIEEKGKSSTFFIANRLAETRIFGFMGKPFWKRAFYMYIPMFIVCAMTLPGSNSSAIFLGIVMLATLMIGGVPLKEIFLGIVVAAAMIGGAAGLYKMSDGKIFGGTRVETLIERIGADYSVEQLETLKERSEEWYKVRDAIKQPYTAKIAIHEGGLLGKGSGNSTQKHVVTHIYSDYMFSFIVEEYGLAGAVLVIILFVSLLARGSMIARLCSNEFGQIAVGGLSLMITGQAFMHIFVNVGIGPMTGQTLPLISDGSFAFLMFCIAFGIILSISKIARNQIREEEEAAAPLYENKDDIQVAMDVLDGIDRDIDNV